jgi:riboflavin synthase
MFTGIIEGLGTLAAIRSSAKGARISVETDFPLSGTRIGDSIAVNGACLTAVTVAGRRFEVDLSPESLATTTFADARNGDRVNLERALRLGDRLDGHLVTGHVDGIGSIASRTQVGSAIEIAVTIPENLSRYLIHKGSVAVDGISLTINACERRQFKVSIIPHTAKMTTVGFKPVGSRVNIETDLIGKYVERFTLRGTRATMSSETENRGVDLDFLNKTGFL